MNWLLIIIAGILEIGCVFSLKFTNGFSKLLPTILYSLFGFGSAYLFSISLNYFQLGLAFLIWFGIAALGVIIIESFFFNKSYSFVELFFMLLIFVGVLGIKYLHR